MLLVFLLLLYCQFELLVLTCLQMQRSKMGKREFGYLYMHAVFRDPQKSWGTHIKGDNLLSKPSLTFNVELESLTKD
jgi:hypothetical protein